MKKLTNEEFIHKLNKIWKNELKPLSQYKSTHEKVLIECKDGHKFEAKPSHLISSKKATGCPVCSIKKNSEKKKLSKKNILDRIKLNTNNEYKIINWLNYKGTRDKVLFKHNISTCGHQFEMTINNFLSGQRCPVHKYENCKLFSNKPHEYYLKKITEQTQDSDEYEFLEQFNGAHNKVKIKHKVCNHEYYATPQKFIDGRRCPNCSSVQNSKPVKFIKKILRENNIPFKTEKIFTDLKNPKTGKYLRFDFYLATLNTVIEYDGEFHFKKSGINNETKLKKVKELDLTKDKYCKNHSINLIRISYFEKDKIQDILNKKLISSSTTIESTSKDGSE
jgi:hypothetical protein